MAKTLLKNPVEVKLAVSKPAEKIQQKAYVCYETQKMAILKDIFKAGDLNRVIIFSGSKQKVKQIAASLKRMKVNCGEMHSDLDQAERDEMMFQFKSGQLDVIVATDIISRGIDIDDIAMVINFDVPRDAEDYVHRIGRTARANRDGVAITLVSEQDQYYFQQIEKFLEKTVEKASPARGRRRGDPNIASRRAPPRARGKSRRREARDQQSHKDKKSRNRQNKQRAEKAAKPQPREADKADQPVVKDGQQQAQPWISSLGRSSSAVDASAVSRARPVRPAISSSRATPAVTRRTKRNERTRRNADPAAVAVARTRAPRAAVSREASREARKAASRAVSRPSPRPTPPRARRRVRASAAAAVASRVATRPPSTPRSTTFARTMRCRRRTRTASSANWSRSR